MDEILANHKAAQAQLKKLLHLMTVGCVLILMLLSGLGYVLYLQAGLRDLQHMVLTETLHQKQALNAQGEKTDQVSEKLDNQPRISVRQPAASDPSGDPVVVIEAPAPTSSVSTMTKPTASKVEIPIKLPSPDKKK